MVLKRPIIMTHNFLLRMSDLFILYFFRKMDDTPAQQSTLTNADRSKRYRKKKIDTDPDFRPKEKGRIGAIRKKS